MDTITAINLYMLWVLGMRIVALLLRRKQVLVGARASSSRRFSNVIWPAKSKEYLELTYLTLCWTQILMVQTEKGKR